MKAYAIDEFGQAGRIREVPDPEPGEGEVLVRVGAASLNPFDIAVVKGYMKERMPHTFPLVPGSDLAGTVERLGVGVTELKVGDRVFGSQGKKMLGEGTLAELVAAAAGTLAVVPDGLSDAEAAALPVAGVSGLALVDAVEAGPGQVVVVVGAGGGVGSHAVQLAAARGARVAGVTSEDKGDYVRGLGATDVIIRDAVDLAGAIQDKYPEGVDAIMDTASDQQQLESLTEAVKPGGRVASMKGAAAAAGTAPRGITTINIQARVSTESLEAVKKLLADGTLRAPAITEFPLERTGEALALLAQGHTRGKLVVTGMAT